MTLSCPPRTLRGLLLLDAATCAAMSALLALGAAPLARLTALPSGLLLWAGLALVPAAAFIATVARRSPPRRAWALLVVLGNLLWVAGSLALPLSGAVEPNAPGLAFLLAQALAVALLAALEALALRAPRPGLAGRAGA